MRHRSLTPARAMPRPPRPARRGGFTLVELLFAIVILTIVTGAILGVLQRQQRFYRGAREIIEARRELRRGSNNMALDLRGLSPASVPNGSLTGRGDIREITDTSITFLTTTGTSVICTLFQATSQIGLPPATLTQGNLLSNFVTAPVVGDSIAVYAEGNSGAANDGYTFHRISAVTLSTAAATCPAASGFTTATDLVRPTYLLTVVGYNPQTFIVGAPVRILKRARYAFRRHTDGLWYLGYSECTMNLPATDACATGLEPVAGPYRPYSTTPGESGLTFSYSDRNGNAVNPAAATIARINSIAAIEVTTRGATSGSATLAGASGTMYDSLRVRIGVRN
ncbi:MAG TPA: type II secretion system protein [Gemmatimonadaceae bacterium]|nr:type II secretion system protein [Gemmatimonadaceae bacterium]